MNSFDCYKTEDTANTQGAGPRGGVTPPAHVTTISITQYSIELHFFIAIVLYST